jgi:hypothetical protein
MNLNSKVGARKHLVLKILERWFTGYAVGIRIQYGSGHRIYKRL